MHLPTHYRHLYRLLFQNVAYTERERWNNTAGICNGLNPWQGGNSNFIIFLLLFPPLINLSAWQFKM